ncbi:RNA polymerase sigma factor [Cohnella sp. REN36]|uniref:RNA polymerase sigma factor n=1 Tax=Cohnella sp. REN36 TaxID=2887347 RepID=UPI001D149F30|nr:sigma-70 family RNA polymerase sigma factor [Cohnella sp. REN36]MCC3376517.1 sigma-70 family RNA polymerase sigma factor [Cohnella sp. REN36]
MIRGWHARVSALEERERGPDGAGAEPADGASERELVERARFGDQEAFGELVRRHRAQALGLAGKLTKDAHLAEDVVQEALIRAFLHLGTLMDTGRFMPWFQRIVRNQAYMKLRRGGPHRKEVPVTGLAAAGDRRQGDREPADWHDLDRILFRLMDHASEEAKRQSNPEACLARKEMLHGIHLLLQCLNPRERGIFEARFFGELSPAEIAALFDTTTAGVYNSLSRSRVKLQRERIRIAIRDYVQKRSDLGLPSKRILATPP